MGLDFVPMSLKSQALYNVTFRMRNSKLTRDVDVTKRLVPDVVVLLASPFLQLLLIGF